MRNGKMLHDKLEHKIQIEQILILFHVQLLILSVILIYLINLYGILNSYWLVKSSGNRASSFHMLYKIPFLNTY